MLVILLPSLSLLFSCLSSGRLTNKEGQPEPREPETEIIHAHVDVADQHRRHRDQQDLTERVFEPIAGAWFVERA